LFTFVFLLTDILFTKCFSFFPRNFVQDSVQKKPLKPNENHRDVLYYERRSRLNIKKGKNFSKKFENFSRGAFQNVKKE